MRANHLEVHKSIIISFFGEHNRYVSLACVGVCSVPGCLFRDHFITLN